MTVDASSEVSTDGMLSSPVGKTGCSGRDNVSEADKQILEWAGKLELETVDLKEKASELTNVFNESNTKLLELVARLNDHLGSIEGGDMKRSEADGFKSLIENLGATLKNGLKESLESSSKTSNGVMNKMMKQLQMVTDCVEKHDSNTVTKSELTKFLGDNNKQLLQEFDARFDEIMKSVDTTQDLVINCGKQLESIFGVMVSVSTEIKNLSDRQTTLEELVKQKAEFQITRKFSNDSCLLVGTTLEEDHTTATRCKATRSPVKGRLRTRLQKQNKTQTMGNDSKIIAKKQHPNRRDLTIARTIIPWEEIDTYYSSEL
ncbi:hypothetical protein Kpol_1050p39 [Vanderwaltozyma polyspora DSM 70294]|uniref:Uncharacterized protein n=1 Tax=Vanderwaltozyma polyspora (strain ATCC 22028 / DSM 70294 / BCRC 21397 / CBS 2163 / NBRC 10782 / NRRL Y-8283 / UCD 57-17) TaxID=436907 RepID=A7TET6_VANPO|nr:uncharacterized protein Kpol_1050p39 [Vanderwaltozyma polyspora DSM 70294]EDO19182.1 hypothetical protein Kpol_1050p39 [Vanderwaltozyma polyspora DSM 70294]